MEILATKLFLPPAQSGCLVRSRLLEQLDPLHLRRLTLISAPAGYGKTTLISTWCDNLRSGGIRPSPSLAWLSLDKGDDDPVVFWTYAVAALQAQLEGIGQQTISMLQTVPFSDLETSLIPLINELSQTSNQIILILDDYHFIRNVAIHNSLSFFIEHAPQHLHLVMLSRIDPPLPLALFRGRGYLFEIRLSDLRFSNEEVEELFGVSLGLNLTNQAVETLNTKTEGWIVGLQMAALSLRGLAQSADHEKVNELIASVSGDSRYILDYLVEEVLGQQPAEIQSFLRLTSVLESFCAPLCDAILAVAEKNWSPNSQVILEYLERSNLFIIPLDGKSFWYRYHHLFSDLLQKRQMQQDSDMIPEIHRRASQWYDQNGLTGRAVDHALQARDYHCAASLISRVLHEMWGGGEHATLLKWMDQLPESEIRKFPHLWIWQATMLIASGNIHEADRCIPQIESYLRSIPVAEQEQSPLKGQFYTLRTYVAVRKHDLPNITRYAHLALDNIPDDDDNGMRCGISLFLSEAFLKNGDPATAGQALIEAIQAGRMTNKPHMVLMAMADLVHVLFSEGNIRQASQICSEGMQLLDQYSLEHSTMAVYLLLGQGNILCEQGEMASAEEFILRGLRLGRERNYIWLMAYGYSVLIRFLLACDDWTAAEVAVQEADRLIETAEVPEDHVSRLAGMKARLLLRLGKIGQAEQYLCSRNIHKEGDIQYPFESEYCALASVYIAQKDLKSAADLLERIYSRMDSLSLKLWVIRTLILRALVSRAQGDQDQSLNLMCRALDLAEPEGIYQSFLDEGESLIPLIAEANRKGIHAEYAVRLLNHFHERPIKQVSDKRVLTSTLTEDRFTYGLSAPLSRREHEALMLIAEGYSNKEIAQKLHVSIRTVKYYATNIFTKLGVNGRTQAALTARKLGLVK